jgi:transcriptional regulator with XRE-family HTH domain
MSTIAENIKKIAEEQSRSLAWLAAQVGMTKVGFYKMLDNNSFKVETIESIARVLGVTPMSLMGYESSNTASDEELLSQLSEAVNTKIPTTPFNLTLAQKLKTRDAKQIKPQRLDKNAFAWQAMELANTGLVLFTLYEGVKNLINNAATDDSINRDLLLEKLMALIKTVEKDG